MQPQFEMVDVAQLVRALDCGSRGRRFEPGLPPLFVKPCFLAGFFCFIELSNQRDHYLQILELCLSEHSSQLNIRLKFFVFSISGIIKNYNRKFCPFFILIDAVFVP